MDTLLADDDELMAKYAEHVDNIAKQNAAAAEKKFKEDRAAKQGKDLVALREQKKRQREARSGRSAAETLAGFETQAAPAPIALSERQKKRMKKLGIKGKAEGGGDIAAYLKKFFNEKDDDDDVDPIVAAIVSYLLDDSSDEEPVSPRRHLSLLL